MTESSVVEGSHIDSMVDNVPPLYRWTTRCLGKKDTIGFAWVFCNFSTVHDELSKEDV